MGLNIKRTALVIVPDGHGTIRVIPKGGREVEIQAPESFRIIQTKERATGKARKKRKRNLESGKD